MNTTNPIFSNYLQDLRIYTDKIHSLLSARSPLFLYDPSGRIADYVAQAYADAYSSEYENIYYLYYTGQFKTDIILQEHPLNEYQDSDMDLFNLHYDMIRSFDQNTLLIIDGYRQQPKDDPFFREFIRNKCQMLFTTTEPIDKYPLLSITPFDFSETRDRIQWRETLTDNQLDLLRTLLLLPANGIAPTTLLSWCGQEETQDLQSLRETGLICKETRNRFQPQHSHKNQIVLAKQQESISLSHDIVRIDPRYAAVLYELLHPCVSNCKKLLHRMHLVCLNPGMDKVKPVSTIQALVSMVRKIEMDDPKEYVMFLQDLFPYMDKYMMVSFLPKLTDEIGHLMEINHMDHPCDKALLLNYKAELFVMKHDFENAQKKMKKALELLEALHNEDADTRVINLLANTYSNQSNLFLQSKKGEDAIRSLRTAFDIRLEYARMGKVETRAMLQQIMNLLSLLILQQDEKQAEEVLAIYESFVLSTSGEQSMEYGVSLLAQGIYTLSIGNPRVAEMNLLRAEYLITTIAGEKNDYARTAFQYLSILYDRWQRPEQAQEYQNKLAASLRNEESNQ